MAKPVVLAFDGGEYTFELSKLERSKLYPTRKRVPLDGSGVPCSRAAMMPDGNNVLKSGMTAQGYFTSAGRWVAKDELVGISPDGAVVDLRPSTLGVAQTLDGPVPLRDLLDLAVVGVYSLEADLNAGVLMASLMRGDVYRFPFNYGADYNCETAYLVANDEGLFALVGNTAPPMWVEEAAFFVADDAEQDDDAELDFEMM